VAVQPPGCVARIRRSIYGYRQLPGTVTLTLGVELMCYHSPMHTVSYHRHRFPAEVIQHAVWLYFRFPLSFRDVEDLLAQRGIRRRAILS
jgi:hypothetical protein